MANPVLNPTLYARVTGFVLAAVAALGIILSLTADGAFLQGFLVFDLTHDIVHVGLAVLALLAGFVASGAYARNYARIFGIVYTVLGIAGWFWTTGFGAGILILEAGENLVHLGIGAWGLACGFIPAGEPATPTARARGT